MMTRRFKFRLFSAFVLAFVLSLAGSASVWAIDLQSAKAQGLVGEQPNGYLGMIKARADVKAMMNDINAKRKKVYQSIAKKNKTKLSVVEQLAGKKAMAKTPKGQYIRAPAGAWMKK